MAEDYSQRVLQAAITFHQACGYLPSCIASPPFSRYQVILLGDIEELRCEQLAQCCYAVLPRVGFEPMTY